MTAEEGDREGYKFTARRVGHVQKSQTNMTLSAGGNKTDAFIPALQGLTLIKSQ